MSKSPKKPAKGEAEKPETPALKQGEKVIGPGVIKRPKKDAAAAATPVTEGDIQYTPSEQVFRRR